MPALPIPNKIITGKVNRQSNPGEPMSNDLTVKSVRTYQAVHFDKRVETFFSTSEINGRRPVEINILKELSVIEISNDSDRILVPLTNISVISLDSKLQKKREAQRKEEKEKLSKTRAAEIKKPR